VETGDPSALVRPKRDMPSTTAKRAKEAERKLREANKLDKRRSVDWSDAALKPLYAQRAREEGERLLAAPEGLVGSAATELVSPREADEDNTRDYLLCTLDEPNTISVAAADQRAEVATRANVLAPALDAVVSAGARSSIEKMLCQQLAAVHHAGMEMLVRVEQLHRLHPVELVRFVNAAARMFDAFQTGCLVLQKLKTRGRQLVVVQHQQVNVAAGGQAIVAGRVGRGSRRGDDGNEDSTPCAAARIAEERQPSGRSHEGSKVRCENQARDPMSVAGDEERPMSDAWWKKYRPADRRGIGAQPEGAVAPRCLLP
jgi:hypothetical protein